MDGIGLLGDTAAGLVVVIEVVGVPGVAVDLGCVAPGIFVRAIYLDKGLEEGNVLLTPSLVWSDSLLLRFRASSELIIVPVGDNAGSWAYTIRPFGGGVFVTLVASRLAADILVEGCHVKDDEWLVGWCCVGCKGCLLRGYRWSCR